VATLNPVLKSFWTTPARNRVLYGGRSSSKSWDAAGFALFLAQYCKIKFLCVRQFQNRIDDSVYTLLKNQIRRFDLSDNFKITNNKIECLSTGSEFVFYGLWRNIEEIRGMEGIGICWLEEAHLLTKEQWQILEPTLIRNPDYQFWVIFNPKLATDFVYKRFVINPPPNTIVRKINYLENPFLNPQALEVIEHLREESLEDYNHFYLGEPKDDDNESIIKRSWIMAAIDAHTKLGIKPSGSKRIGFDVADDGDDACATVKAYGVLTTGIDLWKAKEDEILKSCTRVYRQALDYDSAAITYDAIGVGSSCGAKFNELGYNNHNKFFAGGAVVNPDQKVDKTDKKSKLTNRDFYANIKAQAWWSVSERLKNTYNAVTQGMTFDESDMLFIDSNCQYLEQLIEELSTPRKSFDNAGKVMVESKKDLKKRGIASPNVADAFIMAHLQLPKKSGSF
jgi:phage terminase large subunit